MLFRILGPVAVDGPQGDVQLGGPRHRVLLATLLASPGRVVPLDRLVEAMWGDGPPRRATELVHVRVSELRKALRDGGAEHELIVTHRPGYLIDVDADRVDADRCTRLVEAGRAALDSGDPDAATVLLDEALALWRGPALPELADRAFARPEIARLDGLRRRAVEDRLDAKLAAGRHRAVAVELAPLIEAHPLHEGHRRRLMVALYRDGRQSDALAVYDEISGLLRDELGVDPGAELSELRLSILRHDPALAAPNRARAAAFPAPPLDSFVGRVDELHRVAASLAASRLVTVVGVGGAGKSRLAAETARAVHDRFPTGVHVVELAAVSNPALLAASVAAAVRVREQPGRGLVDAIAEHLSGGSRLLVLDNCEHLLDAVVDLVGHLLGSCPALRVLCTSRERLRATGEVACPLAGLPVPPDGAHDAADVLASDAARLFVDRAVAVQPRLRPVDHATAVAGIVRRLDGLPLAIELAAARTTALAPAQILARLADRFPLLSHGGRDAQPRHQTLRAVVDWSVGLLTDPERRLFARLAVFAGGFTLEAAEAVCGTGLAEDTSELLARLVDKSLVVAEPAASGEYRYRLLETLRAYGVDELERTGAADRTRTAHAAHCRAVATEAAAGLRTDRLPQWLDRLEVEHDNARAAMEWSLAHGDDETAAVIAGSVYKLWEMHARYREGRTWLGRTLADDRSVSDPTRAWGLFADATLAVLEGDVAGGVAACAQALQRGRACDDATVVSRALGLVGFGALVAEDVACAHEVLAEAERTAQDAPWAQAWAVYFRGVLALAEARLDVAVALGARAAALVGRHGDLELRSWVDLNRGHALQRLGAGQQSVHHLGRAITTFGAMHVSRGVFFALISCSSALADRGRPRAARLLAAAETHRTATGTVTAPFIAAWVDEGIAALRTLLTAEEFAEEWRRGEVLSLDEAVDTALAELAACGGVVDGEREHRTAGSAENSPRS